MAMIVAAHYREAEEFYADQNQTIVMACDVWKARLPREEMAHEDGTPTASFMGRCNARYAQLGGASPGDKGGMGSVARAVLAWVARLEKLDASIRAAA